MSLPFRTSPMGNYLLETEYVDFSVGNRFWFIVPPLNWSGVQLELKLSNPTNSDGAMFGYEKQYNYRTFFRWGYGSWQLYTGIGGATYAFDYPAGSELSLSVNYATRIVMVNGEQVPATAVRPYTWGSWCIGDCAYSADGTLPWGNYRNKMRLYSFKMWNNGTPIYDLQPMRDGMGKYWMRNKVDGTLLTRYEQA